VGAAGVLGLNLLLAELLSQPEMMGLVDHGETDTAPLFVADEEKLQQVLPGLQVSECWLVAGFLSN